MSREGWLKLLAVGAIGMAAASRERPYRIVKPSILCRGAFRWVRSRFVCVA